MARKSVTKHQPSESNYADSDSEPIASSKQRSNSSNSQESSSVLVYVYVSVLVGLLAALVYPRISRVTELEQAIDRMKTKLDEVQITQTGGSDPAAEQKFQLQIKQLQVTFNEKLLKLESKLDQLHTQGSIQRNDGNRGDVDVTHLHATLTNMEAKQQTIVNDLTERLLQVEQRFKQPNVPQSVLDGLETRYGRYDERLRRLETDRLQSQNSMVTVLTADSADVGRIVNRLVYRYMADRTERVDYALESTGGKVIAASGVHYVTLWTFVRLMLTFTPVTFPVRNVIRPSMQLSDCWPMSGSSGWVLLQLSDSIFIDAITFEHVAPELAPDFRYRFFASSRPVPHGALSRVLPSLTILLSSTAPRQFHVAASDDGVRYQALGSGEFRRPDPVKDVDTAQTFALGPSGSAARLVNITIESNYGDPLYTCIYRIRVHGTGNPKT